MATLFLVGAGTLNIDGAALRYATTSGGTATVARAVAGDIVTFDANSTGTYTFTDATAFNAASLTAGQMAGSINWNGKTANITGTCSISGTGTRTWTMGAAVFNVGIWTATTTTGLTFNANTSTINATTAGTFAGGGLTYNIVTLGTSALGTAITVSGVNTFATLTRTGPANLIGQLLLSNNQTVTGTLTLTANNTTNRRLMVQSSTIGANMTLTVGTLVATGGIDFQDITGAGAATWTTGASGATFFGDAGGNSGITMTTAAQQTANGTTSFNWSDNTRWTSRVPLPQDNVVINIAFSASQTVTNDMPRLGANITWTGTTGAPIWAFGTAPNTIFGNVTLATGMTTSGTQALTFSGRTTQTITSNGVTLTPPVTIAPATTSGQLGDDYVSTNSFTVGVGFQEGNFVANNHNQTVSTFAGGFGTATDHGTGTLTLTSTAAGSIYSQSPSFSSVVASQATIVIANASANTRTFAGGTYNYGTLTYTVAGSTGELDITGTNTFGTLNFSDITNARTLKITSGTTQTITTPNIVGTSGKKMTLSSITPAAPVNLISSNWLMGANSTDVSGNTGLTFSGGGTMDWLNVQDVAGFTIRPKTQTGVARVLITSVKTINGLARIALITPQTQTGVSRITHTTSQTQTGTSRITQTTARTIAGLSRITITSLQTTTGKARITQTTLKTITGVAKITATTNQTISGKARITAATTKTQTGVARVTNSATKTQLGKSRITIVTPQTITGKSRLTATALKTQQGVARVTATSSQTQSGKSRITITTLKTISGVAKLTAATNRTQTGVARITATTTKTQSGVARITNTSTKTTTGKSRISLITPQTITGKSRLTITTPKTTTGHARVTNTTSQTITGKASIANTTTTTRNITGVARIATEIYSKDTLNSLPSTNARLTTLYTQAQIADTDVNNTSYVDELQTKPLGLHEFEYYAGLTPKAFTPTWIGKTTRPATASPIVLQVYNLVTPGWETLATNSTASAGTPVTLAATQAINFANYFDSRGFIYVRVYQ